MPLLENMSIGSSEVSMPLSICLVLDSNYLMKKKGHRLAGSKKGEQVSGWVKYVILQVVQWFRGREEF
jgi:hypothetical protein